MNIQGYVAPDGTIHVLDHGTYRVADSFNEEAMPHFYGTRGLPDLGRGGVQPDSRLKLPVATFGPQYEGNIDPTLDRPTVSSYEKVKEYEAEIKRGEEALKRNDKEAAEKHFAEARAIIERHVSGNLVGWLNPEAAARRTKVFKETYHDTSHMYLDRIKCRALMGQVAKK